VQINIAVFWLQTPCSLAIVADIPEEYTAYIFGVEGKKNGNSSS
jgi:hypothetical protein